MKAPRHSALVNGLALIVTLGGLLFGYDTAVISGAVNSIDYQFIAPLHLPETARDLLSGLTISSALFGCVIGASIGGWISTAFGRKRGLIVAAVLFLVSALGSAFPEAGLGSVNAMGSRALIPFNLYRVLCGIGVGIASMLSPAYIAEIAPADIRGRLVTYQQMAIVIGIGGVYFVNWAIALQGDHQWLMLWGWRWMLVSEAAPAVLFLVLLLLVPESPRWLCLKNREAEALAVLERLTDRERAERTLDEIRGSLVEHKSRLFAFGWMVVFVGIMLSIFQQFIGINAVYYYAPVMFQNMGASTNSAFLQTVITGAANIVFTYFAMISVDKLGRKPLLFWGGIVMAASMFVLAYLFQVRDLGLPSLIAVVAYVGGFSLSWGPITWVMLAEIFPTSIKGQAMGIAVAAQWLANILVSWSFRVMDGSSYLNAAFHHSFAYWLYGAMSVLASLFVWRFVPETKGHSLEEIQSMWEARSGHSKSKQFSELNPEEEF